MSAPVASTVGEELDRNGNLLERRGAASPPPLSAAAAAVAAAAARCGGGMPDGAGLLSDGDQVPPTPHGGRVRAGLESSLPPMPRSPASAAAHATEFVGRTNMATKISEKMSPTLPPYTPPSLHLDTDAIKEARQRTGWQRGPRALLAMGALSPLGKRLVRGALRLLHLLLWAPLTLMRARRPHRPLPPLRDPLLRHSALDLAQMIRERKVTSTAVVTAYARRVREVNPVLNAVVEDRFTAALQEARAADAAVAEVNARATTKEDEEEALRALAEEKPLLGVPVTIKESIAVQGLPHCAGQRSLKGRRATGDAEVVRRLRAAGAVPLLASNCPELCMHYETFNRITGRSRNPHDTRRTPGGSSGGEAALLGAGASVIGLGSDIGGSSRLPAMFTGVFGHKPTAGVVSDIGHWPRSDDEDWWRFFTLGPMTRYADDLKTMLKVMIKDEARPLLELQKNVNVAELRVFYIEKDGGLTTEPLQSDILKGLHKAVQYLSTMCKDPPQKVYLRDMKYAMDLTCLCLLRMEGIQNVFQIGDNPDEWKSPSMELLKYFLGMSQASLYSLLYGPLKWIFAGVPADVVAKYITIIDRLRSQLEEMLQHNGVLLCPTFVQPAPFHGEMYFYFPSSMYCSIFNILQMPATNCPIGKANNGLPIGIQIVAAPYRDSLSLAVAKELEKAFGGWVEPT